MVSCYLATFLFVLPSSPPMAASGHGNIGKKKKKEFMGNFEGGVRERETEKERERERGNQGQHRACRSCTSTDRSILDCLVLVYTTYLASVGTARVFIIHLFIGASASIC